MNKLTSNFPQLSTHLYLDTPAVGLMPKPVLDFKAHQNEVLWKKGSGYLADTLALSAQVREKIGAVYNADPGYVALFPAFSYGLNALLEGLKRDSKVLLLKNDYPSINWSVEARDFRIVYAEIDENIEKNIYKVFKESRPDVFVFSMVQYLNGVKLDFSFLKDLKKEFPSALLIGDGTQYLGTERFDFKDSALDVVGASAYKWLGAGFGNGFFMFKPGIEERVEPKNLGFGSIRGKYKDGRDSFIGKFEGNHLNPADIGAIKVGMEFQEKIGLVEIEKHIQTLSEETKKDLSRLNLLEDAVSRRAAHSNIFNIKGDDALFEKLQKHQIACSQRGQGIRIGLHYYNTWSDVEKFLKVVS